MAEPLSPLAPVWQPGLHGNIAGGAGVVLGEVRPGSIVQVAAWPRQEKALIAAIAQATGLDLPDGAGAGIAADGNSAFGIGPGRFLVVGRDADLAARLSAAVPAETGTVTDLSHGRTAIRVSGRDAEWLLAKFFAIDFSLPAFPVGAGRATQHHDVLAHIQRTGAAQFDLYVFRSFARSFWKALCHNAEDSGYEVR